MNRTASLLAAATLVFTRPWLGTASGNSYTFGRVDPVLSFNARPPCAASS